MLNTIINFIRSLCTRKQNNRYKLTIQIPEKNKQKAIRLNERFVSKGERECNRVIEEITGKKFNKIRPDWLENPETGYNLELDCYNEELGIAVEYNGEQHYKYPNAFHKSEEEFKSQTKRDKLKKELCDKRNVKLIVVPYTVKLNEIENYIKQQLKS